MFKGCRHQPYESRPVRVRLRIDRTGDHPEFTAGAEGIVIASMARRRGWSPYFLMQLPSGARLPVRWESVSILEADPQWAN